MWGDQSSLRDTGGLTVMLERNAGRKIDFRPPGPPP